MTHTDLMILAKQIDEARARGDYATADRIRARMVSEGYVVMSGPQGTRFESAQERRDDKWFDNYVKQLHIEGDAVTRKLMREHPDPANRAEFRRRHPRLWPH